MKDHLIFSTVSADTIIDSDSVGSFTRAGSDGTLITHHETGKAFASVVYDTVTFTADFAGTAGNSIALVFNGTDTVATVVGAWNTANPTNTVSYSGLGTYVPTAGTATLIGGTDNSGLDVWVLNPSFVVTANNLDIRDLSASQDSIKSWTHDGSGAAITSTGSALDVNIKTSSIDLICDLDGIYNGTTNLTPDNVGAIFFTRAVTPGLAQQVETVTAATLGTIATANVNKIHALDVNSFLYALNPTSGDIEQVTIDDVNGGLNVNIANSLSVTTNDAALANTAIKSRAAALTAAGTAQVVVAGGDVIADRKYLFVYNNDNRVMYVGGADVSASNGFPISPGSYLELRAGTSSPVNFDSAKTGHVIRTLQLS